MFVVPTTQEGFAPSEITYPCVNRSGADLEAGDVVALDLAGSATEVDATSADSFIPGIDGDTVWRTVIQPTAAYVASGILGVVTEKDGIADDEVGNVTFYGVVDAYVFTTVGTTDVDPGDPLVAKASSHDLDVDTASGERIIALHNAPTVSAPSTHVTAQVFFNGITGFGDA